jgi:hypothetical protein
LAIEGDRIQLDKALRDDYWLEPGANASTAFPVITAEYVSAAPSMMAAYTCGTSAHPNATTMAGARRDGDEAEGRAREVGTGPQGRRLDERQDGQQQRRHHPAFTVSIMFVLKFTLVVQSDFLLKTG